MPDSLHRLVMPTRRTSFFFLTASPYNLFPLMRNPVNLERFPAGRLILPTAWQALGFLLCRHTILDYKLRSMHRVLSSADDRNLICIGDSSYSDFDVYKTFFEKYPQKRGAIAIRALHETSSSVLREHQMMKRIPHVKYTRYATVSELDDFLMSLEEDLARSNKHAIEH